MKVGRLHDSSFHCGQKGKARTQCVVNHSGSGGAGWVVL